MCAARGWDLTWKLRGGSSNSAVVVVAVLAVVVLLLLLLLLLRLPLLLLRLLSPSHEGVVLRYARERSCAMRGRSALCAMRGRAVFRQMFCYVWAVFLRVMSCVGGLPLCSSWCDLSQVKMTKRETAHKWKERSGRPLTLCCTCFDQAGDRSQPKMTKRETARTDN